jgi:hypothetical protein
VDLADAEHSAKVTGQDVVTAGDHAQDGVRGAVGEEVLPVDGVDVQVTTGTVLTNP